MFDILGKQHRHRHRRTHTVVGTQRRIIRIYPIPFDTRADRITIEIMRRIRRFLRHHINMRLQNHPGFFRHTRPGRRLIKINIALVIRTRL